MTCPSAVAVWCLLLVDSFGQCSTLWYWLLYHCISAIYYNHTHSVRRLLGSHISFYMNQSRRKTAARRISSLVTCPVGITGNVLAWLQWELLDKQEMKSSILKYIALRLNETGIGSFSYLLQWGKMCSHALSSDRMTGCHWRCFHSFQMHQFYPKWSPWHSHGEGLPPSPLLSLQQWDWGFNGGPSPGFAPSLPFPGCTPCHHHQCQHFPLSHRLSGRGAADQSSRATPCVGVWV